MLVFRFIQIVGFGSILLTSALSWAHGGEDHSEPAPVQIGVSNFVSAQSNTDTLEAVLQGKLSEPTLTLYLSLYQTNAPLADAEVEVSGLALAGPIQQLAPGQYQVPLAHSLAEQFNDTTAMPVALTVSATIGDDTLLELLDLSLQRPALAQDDAAHDDANSSAQYWLLPLTFMLGLVLGALALGFRQTRRAKGASHA